MDPEKAAQLRFACIVEAVKLTQYSGTDVMELADRFWKFVEKAEFPAERHQPMEELVGKF